VHLPEIDKYSHLKSVFHSWDPRVKLVSFSFLMLSIAFLPNLLSAFLGLILAIILIFLSKIPFSFVLKHLKWVILFTLFFFIIMPLTVPGDRMFKLNFITISYEGLRLSLLIAMRAISICMILFPMVGTTQFHKTLKALEKLRIPNKLIQMIMFTYRYLFVFLAELIRMSTAAEARLFKRRTDIHTLKITGNLIGILLIQALERTQRVYNAMTSRGYKGKIRTLDEFRLSWLDFLKGVLIIALAVSLSFTRLIR
jgi:cobalt/nickel transport system permease protein